MTSTVLPDHHERDYRAPDGRTVFHVHMDVYPEQVSIRITDHPTLNRLLPLQQGRDYLRLLRDEAAKGTPTWLIKAMAGAYTSAAAIVDDAEQALVDRINADLDERRAQREQDAADLAAKVEDALASDREAHATWRDTTRKQVTSQANANIGAYAHGAPNQRPVPKNQLNARLLARAFSAATPAGDIYVTPGLVAGTFLEAMARHRLGRVIYDETKPRRMGVAKPVIKLHLSPAGRLLATQHKENAR